MQPVLFSVLGLDIQTYGLSKALAAVVGAFLLGRAFQRRGYSKDVAHSLVLWATVVGFAAAKLYYLAEQLPDVTAHDFAGTGFTWYGGLLGGVAAALVVARRNGLPIPDVAGLAAVPLTVAYGIGRLGCLLSGDGTYGRPTDLPWGMAFPNGAVPTDVPVHPTPLYEALAAVVIALLLTRFARHVRLPVVFAGYLVLSGAARFLVENLRINDSALLGMTQPQLWALLSIAVGLAVMLSAARAEARSRPRRGGPPAGAGGTVLEGSEAAVAGGR
ncbi:prolipoprotein diacylglyceryl transferase [Actinotalea sp. Marseille-Q4924]|uniref:prolipoprotein diacylglyceryl transferase n=1 Tax=Actinotalea sp. Marseille-Q4924 TaxID=2866571 RepID=UPI001CE3D9CD|nr:prolipoprotein diacylglyceryl transferase [Actinotalea sp. Marseille-Q4924]